ncbi:hypothetical protein [Sphingopyxis sp. PET50]|uniref:hypothetical protein n=1 Tax=Sphingopyxis sp. PET50 TaxID=2976533 RepID=UPI0021AE3263|nr:hypothetical protein [Sphingopyxis sp. PET50]
MKILTPVSGNRWAVPDCYFRGLVAAGADAVSYDVGEAPTSLAGRILRRFERMTGSAAAKRLEAAVEAVRPDILVVFKGFDYPPALLRRIAARGIILANYNTDHPFRFFSPGSGNANVRDSVPLYRLYMTYSGPIGRELEAANPEQKVLVLPFGHAIDDALHDELATEAEVVRGCFNGNPDEERAEAVRFLARQWRADGPLRLWLGEIRDADRDLADLHARGRDRHVPHPAPLPLPAQPVPAA